MMLHLAKSQDQKLFVASALVSNHTRDGHICLDLNELNNPDFLDQKFGENADIPIPSTYELINELPKFNVVGQPGEFKPLILDRKNRLYLNRYWSYQENLTEFIKERIRQTYLIDSPQETRDCLNQLFPPHANGEIDWQKIAAITTLLKNFCVITGGPGTGKTYTIAKILALLIEQSGRDLKIQLAAPTGKAAVRLQDSIKQVKERLPCSDEIKTKIPEEAATIHRLLGTIRHSPYFRHDTDNPLKVDVMIVDEASMVDLALMTKLTSALPSDAKLILLGDNNQLASVEAGAVLADICGFTQNQKYFNEFATIIKSLYGQKIDIETTENKKPEIKDFIVRLQRSYRFESQKGIGALSQCVNAGDADCALEVLQDPLYPNVTWHNLGDKILSNVLQELEDFSQTTDVADFFEKYNKLRILCAVREGPYGVKAINSQVQQFVKKKNGIKQNDSWYAGQPIMVTENDYSLNLFNGDLGIIYPDGDNNNELHVFFPGQKGMLRKLKPFRLPSHEVAYAITVHKSQGSEFEKVILVLPDIDSPILTRELIYTAITRASKSVEIWGSEEIFRAGVARQTKRTSGLRDALWGG